MEEFFDLYGTCSNRMSWFEEAPKSAFQRYRNQPFDGVECPQNANKKMIEFLKKRWVAPLLRTKTIGLGNDRSLKHKMVERMRRMKHKQIYLELHRSLPHGTKSDKNSILEMATKEIQELQQYSEELRKKNGEMEMSLKRWEVGKAVEQAEIKLKVDYPASGADSMLGVLHCLKNAGCTATAIQSNFSQQEFSAEIEFETKLRAADVERSIQTTLFEAEMRFRSTNPN